MRGMTSMDAAGRMGPPGWMLKVCAKGVPGYAKGRQSLDVLNLALVEAYLSQRCFASDRCGIATVGFGRSLGWPTLDRLGMIHGLETRSGKTEAATRPGAAPGPQTFAQAHIQTLSL